VECVSSQERDRTLRHYEKKMDDSNPAKRTEDFGVCRGKLLFPKIHITGVWPHSEGPDREVRRERVTPVSATKVICWPATVPITLGSVTP
jgi:hypothetical protein